jgi:hypothetical protein
MKQKYRNWSEGTSTSLSGRHLRHKHALVRPCGLSPNCPGFEILDTLCKTIWSIHHGMLNFGYCYNRWKTVVTTVIEKKTWQPTHSLPLCHFSIQRLLQPATWSRLSQRPPPCRRLPHTQRRQLWIMPMPVFSLPNWP